MNLYLIQTVGKWISLFVVSIASMFGMNTTQEEKSVVNHGDYGYNTVNTVIPHEVEYQYNEKLPSDVKRTLVEGNDGLMYFDEETSSQKILEEPVTEVIEVGTGDQSEYVGRMTGYGPDCPGCSKVGNVACFTEDRENHSLIYDGIYYQDDEYGEVRILAAARSKFPCGTIVLVDNGTLEPFYGVVLDTGSSMRNAWSEGEVWMDLAFESQAAARKGNATSYNTKYTVQRWGW